MTNPLIHVVAGVIYNTQGQILIAQRNVRQHQGGLWEFPGGKVEPGELPQQALVRELEEELGITATRFVPLIQIVHHYADKSVLLDVWKVLTFRGELGEDGENLEPENSSDLCPDGRKIKGLEGQPLRWVELAELGNYDFPAANKPILKALVLPNSIAITGHAPSRDQWFNRLEQLLVTGIGMVQLRSVDIPAAELTTYVVEASQLCRSRNIPLILNSRLAPLEQLIKMPCSGIHLTSQDWSGLAKRPIPSNLLLSLPCHTAEEIVRAELLEADLILVSPVLPTTSHPNARPLGWQTFSEFCLVSRIPVFGLGGLSEQDIAQAKSFGAQGVAGISGFWPVH